MSASGNDVEETVEVKDRGEDVLIETPVLNSVCDGGTIGPIDFTDRFAERVRENVRRRRTENAIAQRVANNAVTPVVDALEGELAGEVKRAIERRRRR